MDIIDSTVRAGITIDQVEFAVLGAQPATAYVLGHIPGEVQPVVLALHHDRGDKATLLPDLAPLAARGFVCLSIDSPSTRQAVADRRPVEAFDQQYRIAETALNLLQGDPELIEHRVALIGRGIGGEVAARLAAHTHRCPAVVTYNALPERSRYVRESAHPLAAGLRWALRDEGLAAVLDDLERRDLVPQLKASPHIHWMLQVADDDDRLDEHDSEVLASGIPHSVRVRRQRTMAELVTTPARRERVDFLSDLLL